jgi:hypothetical protein
MLTFFTRPGDVLILQTEKGLKIHAVGRVTKAGQQDFHQVEPAPVYIVEHAEAVALAQALVVPGRRIFLVKLDSEEWLELSN